MRHLKSSDIALTALHSLLPFVLTALTDCPIMCRSYRPLPIPLIRGKKKKALDSENSFFYFLHNFIKIRLLKPANLSNHIPLNITYKQLTFLSRCSYLIITDISRTLKKRYVLPYTETHLVPAYTQNVYPTP